MFTRFDHDAYIVGQQARMYLSVDATDLKTHVKEMEVQLVQSITIRAHSEFKYISRKINSTTVAGVVKGDKKIDVNSIPVTLTIDCK